MLELLTADNLAEFWPSQSSSMKLSLSTAKGNNLPEDWQRRSRLEANGIWSQRRIHVTFQSSPPNWMGHLLSASGWSISLSERTGSVEEVDLDRLARGGEN